jgi:tRNA A-37 threonylcarbamoyl transferase component Bud32
VREVGTGGGGTVFLATDPELGRPVAVKLIDARDPAVRARAVAEGQALAKLSHPHVVQVFDVGVVDDRVYLVMELVRGESLRAYAEHATRRDVIRAYRQAGEGLVAAHDAGIVHRDFKPDNAMRGADGRVRVVDFGLAGAEGDPAAGGTPRYMAPEQARGEAVTAAVDQYAFAASLREAVGRAGRAGGARPATESDIGRGRQPPTPTTVAARPNARAAAARADVTVTTDAPPASVSKGAGVGLAPPAAGASLPRWLEAIVARGTATDPAARFPSMTALLRALANDPAARWRRRALVAAPLAIGAIGFAVGSRGGDSRPSCDQGSAAIAPAWTAERAAAADAHVIGLGTPFAAAAAPRTRETLAAYATGWTKAFDAACVAARREPSATVVARRSACLASARTRLGAAVDLVATIDADKLPSAIQALAELPDLERCADASALVSDVAPPTAAQAREVAAIEAELDRARVDIDAALPSAPAKTAVLLERARGLGYRPLLARALLAHGRAELAVDRFEPAIAPLTEASSTAIAERDDVTAVEASARLILARSHIDRPEMVLAGLAPIRALSTRLGPRDAFVLALLHNHMGVVENGAGNADRARDELRAALAIARGVTGPGAVELAWVRTNLALLVEDPSEREQLEAEAVAIARDRLGEDHPFTLTMRVTAAFGIAETERARTEMRAPCARTAQQHPNRAQEILACAYELAILDLASDAQGDARASFALALGAVGGEAIDPNRVAIARAYVAHLDGDLVTADESFAALAAKLRPTADTPWYDLFIVADVELGRAAVAKARTGGGGPVERDAVERAIDHLDRAASTNPLLIVKRRAAWARGWADRLRSRPPTTR